MNARAYEPPAIVASSDIAPGYHSHAIAPATVDDMNACIWACWSCGDVTRWYTAGPAAIYAFRADGSWGRVTQDFAAELRPPQAAPIPTCARCEHAAQATIDETNAALERAQRNRAFIEGKI